MEANSEEVKAGGGSAEENFDRGYDTKLSN